MIRIAISDDPRMANREKLVELVVEYSRFQVLVLDSNDDNEPKELLEQPGITGQMKPHLVELSVKYKELREFLHGTDTSSEYADLWNIVLMWYQMMFAWTHVFMMLRFPLEDYNPAKGKDWFKPFVSAMCGVEEHYMRDSIGLEPALYSPLGDEGTLAMMMSSFVNCVMEGHRWPDLEWRKNMDEFNDCAVI